MERRRIEDSITAQRLLKKFNALSADRQNMLMDKLQGGKMEKKLIPVKEAAERLQISEQTVRSWWRDDKLKGKRIGPRKIFIYEFEVDRFLGGDEDETAG